MSFRDGQSLEVVTNLCFATLKDVSKHIKLCELLSVDLSLCKHKLVFYGFNIMV